MRTKSVLRYAAAVAAGRCLLGPPARPQPQSEEASSGASAQRALLDQYCITCHSQAARDSGLDAAQRLTLDDLEVARVQDSPERWERVVRKLRAGMMPPSGLPRPDPETLESLVVWLETELDRTAVPHLPAPGLHRLNRTEYANAIRDLLALQIDPADYLPADDSTRGFDNIAGALSISPALLESYVSAAAKISRMALGHVTAPRQRVYRVPEDASQEYHIEGTRGGIKIENEFPADADYGFVVYPVNKGNMDLNTAFGEIRGEQLEILLDGERIKLFDHGADVNVSVCGVESTPTECRGNSTETRTIFTMQWIREDGATPFFRAAQSGDIELMRLLLEHGADPMIATAHDVTPLAAASGIGWVEGVTFEWSDEASAEAVRLLLDLGIDPNVISDEGRAALHGAAHKGRNEVVRLLVDAGAKLDQLDFGSRDTGNGTLLGHRWIPLNYAEGLVRVGVQSPLAHPETAALIRELMAEQGLEIPPPITSSICVTVLCEGDRN